MATIRERTHVTESTDSKGNVTRTETSETTKLTRSDEPDFIKIYTRMWCEFNQIPEKWRTLFLSLVCKMSFACLSDSEGGQIVYTVGPQQTSIIRECGWKNKDTLYRGLTELCNCKAIRKIGRGVYQISPKYAGKGHWKYNPSTDQGGIENIIAKFNFKDKDVETKLIWASTNKKEIGNKIDQVVATETTIKNQQTDDDIWDDVEPEPAETV